MKRCPQCNRVEPDDALAFCRVDGAALVNASSAFKSEPGTSQLGAASPSPSTEIETSILPHATNANIDGPASTTVLHGQQAQSTTRDLSKTSRRKVIVTVTL